MKRLLVLLSILVLMFGALSPLMAQDEEGEWVEYEQEYDLFSFEHPEGWAVDFDEDEGTIYIANSEEALDAMQDVSDETIESGQFGMTLILFPVDLMSMIGIEVDMEAEAADALESLTEDFFAFAMEMNAEEEMERGDFMLLESEEEDGTSFGLIPLSSAADEMDGYLAVFEAGEGIYGIAVIAAYSGELADYEETAQEVLASLEVNVTAEELLDFYMSGFSDDDMDDDMDDDSDDDMDDDDMDEPAATEEPGS